MAHITGEPFSCVIDTALFWDTLVTHGDIAAPSEPPALPEVNDEGSCSQRWAEAHARPEKPAPQEHNPWPAAAVEWLCLVPLEDASRTLLLSKSDVCDYLGISPAPIPPVKPGAPKSKSKSKLKATARARHLQVQSQLLDLPLAPLRRLLEANALWQGLVGPPAPGQALPFRFCKRHTHMPLDVDQEEATLLRDVTGGREWRTGNALMGTLKLAGIDASRDRYGTGIVVPVTLLGAPGQGPAPLVQGVFDALVPRPPDCQQAMALLQQVPEGGAYLFADGALPHIDYTPLLHASVAADWAEGVQELLQRRRACTPTALSKVDRDGRGRTALHVAVEAGAHEALRVLLSDDSVCIDALDMGGRTAAQRAVQRGCISAAVALVAAGASPLRCFFELANIPDEHAEFGAHLIHWALCYSQVQVGGLPGNMFFHIVRLLLARSRQTGDPPDTELLVHALLVVGTGGNTAQTSRLLSLLQLGTEGRQLFEAAVNARVVHNDDGDVVRVQIVPCGHASRIPAVTSVALHDLVTHAPLWCEPDEFAFIFSIARVRRMCHSTCASSPNIEWSEPNVPWRATPLHTAVCYVAEVLRSTRTPHHHTLYSTRIHGFTSIERAAANLQAMLDHPEWVYGGAAPLMLSTAVEAFCPPGEIYPAAFMCNANWCMLPKEQTSQKPLCGIFSPLYFPIVAPHLPGRAHKQVAAWQSTDALLRTLLSKAGTYPGLDVNSICYITSSQKRHFAAASRPLCISVAAGNAEATRLLLEHGACPTLQQRALFAPLSGVLVEAGCNTPFTRYPPQEPDPTLEEQEITFGRSLHLWHRVCDFLPMKDLQKSVQLLSKGHYDVVHSHETFHWRSLASGVLTDGVADTLKELNQRRAEAGEAPLTLNMCEWMKSITDTDDLCTERRFLVQHMRHDLPHLEFFGSDLPIPARSTRLHIDSFEALSIGHDRYDLGFLDWSKDLRRGAHSGGVLEALSAVVDAAPHADLHGVSLRNQRESTASVTHPLEAVLLLEQLCGTLSPPLSQRLLAGLEAQADGGRLPMGCFGSSMRLAVGTKAKKLEQLAKRGIDATDVPGWTRLGLASLEHDAPDCQTGSWFAPDTSVAADMLHVAQCGGRLYDCAIRSGNTDLLSRLCKMSRVHERVELHDFTYDTVLQEEFIQHLFENESDDLDSDDADGHDDDDDDDDDGDDDDDISESNGNGASKKEKTLEPFCASSYSGVLNLSSYDMHVNGEPMEVTQLAMLIVCHGTVGMLQCLMPTLLACPEGVSAAAHQTWQRTLWMMLLRNATLNGADGMLPHLLDVAAQHHHEPTEAADLWRLTKHAIEARRPQHAILLLDRAAARLPPGHIAGFLYGSGGGAVPLGSGTADGEDDDQQGDTESQDSLFVLSLHREELCDITAKILALSPLPDTLHVPERPTQSGAQHSTPYNAIRTCAQLKNPRALLCVVRHIQSRGGAAGGFAPTPEQVEFYLASDPHDDEEEEEESESGASTAEDGKPACRKGLRLRSTECSYLYSGYRDFVLLPRDAAAQHGDSFIHDPSLQGQVEGASSPGFASDTAKAYVLQGCSALPQPERDTVCSLLAELGTGLHSAVPNRLGAGCMRSSTTGNAYTRACLRLAQGHFREGVAPPGAILIVKRTQGRALGVARSFVLSPASGGAEVVDEKEEGAAASGGGDAPRSTPVYDAVDVSNVGTFEGTPNEAPTRLKIRFSRKKKKKHAVTRPFAWRKDFVVVGGWGGWGAGDVVRPDVSEGQAPGRLYGPSAVYSPEYRASSRDFRNVELTEGAVGEELGSVPYRETVIRSKSRLANYHGGPTGPVTERPDVHAPAPNQFYTLVLNIVPGGGGCSDVFCDDTPRVVSTEAIAAAEAQQATVHTLGMRVWQGPPGL